MSAAAKAPSSASSATGTASMPGLPQRGQAVAADLLAALHQEVAGLHVGGGAQPDCRLSDTTHIRDVPRFRITRSTV